MLAVSATKKIFTNGYLFLFIGRSLFALNDLGVISKNIEAGKLQLVAFYL